MDDIDGKETSTMFKSLKMHVAVNIHMAFSLYLHFLAVHYSPNGKLNTLCSVRFINALEMSLTFTKGAFI